MITPETLELLFGCFATLSMLLVSMAGIAFVAFLLIHWFRPWITMVWIDMVYKNLARETARKRRKAAGRS